MIKKSTKARIKKLIYPLAFVLVIILSVIYKFVFKGSGDITVNAFKSGRSAPVSESEIVPTESHEPVVSDDAAFSSAAVTIQLISIYICGEVNRPGIYEAPKGVMLNDIIEKAGGLTEDASANNINFVYQITGNMSIYIPSKAEVEKGFNGGDIIRQEGVYVWGNLQGQTADSGGASITIVNINTAAVDELKNLPGIGEVTAQAIVDYRKKNPFKTVEDIKNVTGIGDSKFSRIKDYICV